MRFRDATIAELSEIERPSSGHLHWPELDVDLTVDAIENPSAYPLVSGARTVRESGEDED